MHYEHELLKLFAVRELHTEYIDCVKFDILMPETQTMLKAYKKYYQNNPDRETIDPDVFAMNFLKFETNTQNPETILFYNELVEIIKQPVCINKDDLVEQLKYQKIQYNLMRAFEEERPILEIKQQFDKDLEKATDKAYCAEIYDTLDLDFVDEAMDGASGYHWPIKKLDRCMGGLKSGEFGVIAARPDSGKTSWLACISTCIARQNVELMIDRPVLWFNNEGDNKRIKGRIYTVSLGLPWEEVQKNKESSLQELKDNNTESIILIDAKRKNYLFVEHYIKKYNPCLVIIDMLDYVQGFEKNRSNEPNDQVWDRLYHWCLEIAGIYNCTVIGTSQMNKPEGYMDFDKRNELYKWPQLENLKGSSTAKQGAASFVMFIGRSLDIFDEKRCFSAPKNKYGSEAFRLITKFDSSTGIYTEA